MTSLHAQEKIDSTVSIVYFIATNLGANVNGNIEGMSGSITFDSLNLKRSNFVVSIPTKKIDTDNKMRDEHLHKIEYFDVKNYPIITFKSSNISKTKKGSKVTGLLKIKKTTKTITIPFTVSDNKFEGNFVINRNEYNIGKNGFLNPIGDDVKIKISCFIDE